MLIAQIPTVGQTRCIFDDNYGIFFIISQSGDSNEQHKLIFLRRTDQSCILIIINIRTFSGLPISWIFFGNQRYNLLSKSYRRMAENGFAPPPREFCRHILSCRELKAASFKRCLHSVRWGVSL